MVVGPQLGAAKANVQHLSYFPALEHDLITGIERTIQYQLNAAENVGEATVQGQANCQTTNTEGAQDKTRSVVPDMCPTPIIGSVCPAFQIA